MSKAYSDLDMNTNDITNAANLTAAGTVRSNAQFNRNGVNGISSIFTITDSSGDHDFQFGGGLLKVYAGPK